MAVTKGETNKALAAFEYYYQLGDDRTLEKVSIDLHISKATLSSWSTKYGWVRRCIERHSAEALKLQKQLEKQMLEDKIHYREIIRDSIATYVKALKEGGIQVTTVKDLVKLMETDLDIMSLLESKDTTDEAASKDTNSLLESLTAELQNVEEPEDEDV